MSFSDGMRLGQQAYQFGVQDAREQRRFEAEQRAIAAAEQRAAAAESYMTDQAGKAEQAALGVDYAPVRSALKDGPPTDEQVAAMPPRLAMPTKDVAYDSPEMASVRGMRLAAMTRDVKGFQGASAANDSIRRGQRYQSAAEQIMKDPTQVIEAINNSVGNGMMVADMGGGKMGVTIQGAAGKGGAQFYKLSQQDAKQFLVAQMMAKDGDLDGSFKLMDATNKTLGEFFKQRFDQDFKGAQEDGLNRRAAAQIGLQYSELDERARHNSVTEQQAASNNALGYMREAVQLVKPDGSVGMFYPTPNGKMVELPLPEGLKLPQRSAAANAYADHGLKPGQSPEVGQEYVNRAGQVQTYYGNGVFGQSGGIPVADRPAALKKAGVNPAMAQTLSSNGRLGWHTDQKSVMMTSDDGKVKVYDINNPGDVKALNDDMRKMGAAQIKADEAAKKAKLPTEEQTAHSFSIYKARTQPMQAPNSFRDPTWDAIEMDIARMTGVPYAVLRGIRVDGERSNGNQVSPKGAKGVYQFMRDTRDLFLKKYNVDAYSNDPRDQVMAAALHLKDSYGRTKSWVKAVAGYNGGMSGENGINRTKENRDYVQRVASGLQLPNP